ncbi:uncharacterized protein TRAVEDRAFT_81890, partial [Trametes versicolor FP-101664 SS1]|uniref:uncharacterized protein n=1 Tax=Trametes versicolor (strain FP-101664) TaxID=717944 RepID=UPI000462131D
GPRLPRRDRENERERYCRLMLILFKPWRNASELLGDALNWDDAYEAHAVEHTDEHKRIIRNMQLLHECRDSRND